MTNTRTNETRVGNLNLCDLAGSERVSSAKTTGEQFEETKKINLSLSALNRVFRELAEGNDHVPFRETKLTDLLQYCLSGNGKTMMIVNLSPTAASAQETHGSLELAQTVSKIQKGKDKKGAVGKIGATRPAQPTIRKQPPQPIITTSHSSSQTTMNDDIPTPNKDGQDDAVPATSQSSSTGSLRSRLNEFKRIRIQQPINIMTGDEDLDSELVSLDQYSESPAPFELDAETSQLFLASDNTLDQLQALTASLQTESNSINTILTTISTALDAAKQLLPQTNMGSVYDAILQPIDPQVYIQPQLDDAFVSKFDYFQDKLNTLRNSIQTSTLELSRKGQTLQLNSLQLELASHQERIEIVFVAACAQLSIATNTQAAIRSLQQPLLDIYQSLETAQAQFKQEYDTTNQAFLEGIDQINLEFESYVSSQRQTLIKDLQETQHKFKKLYSTGYLLEIGALEKASELFVDVKRKHDEVTQQYGLLDWQVKGFEEMASTPPETYIQKQRLLLQDERDKLTILEEQCTTYDSELLQERRNKLAKYRHHNQQLEMKIASLGGEDALISLMTQPNKPLKTRPNNIAIQPQFPSTTSSSTSAATTTTSTTTSQGPQQQKIYSDDDNTNSAPSSTSKPSTSASKPSTSDQSKPFVRSTAVRTNVTVSAPGPRPTMAGKAIPTTTAGVTKSRIGDGPGSLSRVGAMRTALRK